jgi:hypothetical protein
VIAVIARHRNEIGKAKTPTTGTETRRKAFGVGKEKPTADSSPLGSE